MNFDNNLANYQSERNNNYMNYNHIHIICPFNYCSCICCVCNYYLSCQCLCHQIKNKTTRNNISLNNCNNISIKTPLSNYSNGLYLKDIYKNKNDIYNLSPNKNNNERKNSINQKYLAKRLFHNRLNKSFHNKERRYYHSHSLSDINNMGRTIGNESHRYLTNKQRFFNKSYLSDFYKTDKNFKENNYNYNPSSERDNILAKNIFKEDGKYLNIKEDKSEDKNYPRKDVLNYDNYYKKTIDLNNNINKKGINKKYLNNYFQKRNKYKSCLNSAEKKEKIMNMINNRKRKDVYLSLDTNKNSLNLNKENNKNYETFKKENKNIYDNNAIKYIDKKERMNNYKDNKHLNYKNLRQIQNINKKQNKNHYNKLNFSGGNLINNNNLNDDFKEYNNIRNNNNNLDNDSDNINNILYEKENSFNLRKYNSNTSNNYLIINSFYFSIYSSKDNSITNMDEINALKRELIKKNQEILEYKIKINSLINELDFYKNEIKNSKIKNNIQNKKQNENHYIYRKKSKEEINSNINNNNENKNGKYFLNNNKNNEIKLEINKKNNRKNKIIQFNDENDKNEKLLSKLNIKVDLNLTKESDYISSKIGNEDISNKSIYVISSLTKSKSILCFDYINKKFSFRDYADFGDFQDNYILSFENGNEYSKNNSIFLVIDYNYYIVTGENCDMLYVYNSLKRTMNKLCNLKNNHANGALINYSNNIICISGNYNKKVELYYQSKNEWINLPELNIERRNFSTCLIKNKYIFCLFGYNFPAKQYLNTIEYLDIENYKNSSWKYLKYKNDNLLSLYITCALGINYKDEKIIIVGGNNGQENKYNEYFYQIILSENFENNKESYVEKTKRKLKDIDKNKSYIFNKGYNIFDYKNNLFYMAFDDFLRVHLFQVNNMAYDIFYFE